MHVVPKVLSMRSGGIGSLEVDWVSWMVSGESACISIVSQEVGSISILILIESSQG